MIDFDSFMSEELMIAPEHPLAQNLELPIPDPNSAGVEQIRDIQRRDRIPGIVKRFILVDADTLWQYWWCVPGRLLLPEDVELLSSDLPRLEAILEKLIWLFGGHCFSANSQRDNDLNPIYQWQEVLTFAQQHGFKSYVLDIDYMPLAIKRDPRHSPPTQGNPDAAHIAVEPPHWHVEFLQPIPTDGGFELLEPKTVCSCQIWTGKPFLRHLPSSIASAHYNLWVSRPMDITQPPWRQQCY